MFYKDWNTGITGLRRANSCVKAGVRPFTFFESGVVGHVGFADPFDEKIAQVSPAH